MRSPGPVEPFVIVSLSLTTPDGGSRLEELKNSDGPMDGFGEVDGAMGDA